VVLFLAILAASSGFLYYCHWKETTSRKRCQANLHYFWVELHMYGPGQSASFPPSLQAMFLDSHIPSLYICPASGHHPGVTNHVELWTDYAYVSGLDDSAPTGCVLAFCPPENHQGEGANVLFVDGKVRWYSVEEFKKLTNDPFVFFGVNESNALEKLRSKTKILYPKH
jgi:prepilin-type processing-associated H-X9-DG protein